MKKSKNNNLDSIMAELKLDYLNKFPARIKTIESLIAKKEIALVQSEFHKLKGNGKTLGFQWISELAGNIESQLKALKPNSPTEKIEAKLYKATSLLKLGFTQADHFDLESQTLWRDINNHD